MTEDRIPFRSRGVGVEWRLKCFCCLTRDNEHRTFNPFEGGNGLLNNISGCVNSKEDGEKVVAMFESFDPEYLDSMHSFARLDYRPAEPNHVQVKIGACNKHIRQLRNLDILVSTNNSISAENIRRAIYGNLIPCDVCEGTGAIFGMDKVKTICPTCRGYGKRYVEEVLVEEVL